MEKGNAASILDSCSVKVGKDLHEDYFVIRHDVSTIRRIDKGEKCKQMISLITSSPIISSPIIEDHSQQVQAYSLADLSL